MAHERTVRCPYDPIHEIREAAFAKHLLKCAKNFPNVNLEICPVNAIHRYRKEEGGLAKHLETCPDRGLIERTLYRMPDSVVSASLSENSGI